MHPSEHWEKSLKYADIDVWDEEVSMLKDNSNIYDAWCLEQFYRNNKKIPVCFIEKSFIFHILNIIRTIVRLYQILDEMGREDSYKVTKHYDQYGAYVGKSFSKKRRCRCRCRCC